MLVLTLTWWKYTPCSICSDFLFCFEIDKIKITSAQRGVTRRNPQQILSQPKILSCSIPGLTQIRQFALWLSATIIVALLVWFICLLGYLLAWLDFAACVLLINSQHLSTSLTPPAPKQAKVWIFMYFWICQGTTSTSYFSDSFVIFAEAIDSSSLVFFKWFMTSFWVWSLKL